MLTYTATLIWSYMRILWTLACFSHQLADTRHEVIYLYYC